MARVCVTSPERLARFINCRNETYGVAYGKIAQEPPFFGLVSKAEVWRAANDPAAAEHLFEKLVGHKPLEHWGRLDRIPRRVLHDAIRDRVPAEEIYGR